MDEFQGMPLTSEHVDEKELDTAIAYSHGCSGPLVIVFPVEEIVLKLLFANFVGGFAVKIHQHPN